MLSCLGLQFWKQVTCSLSPRNSILGLQTTNYILLPSKPEMFHTTKKQTIRTCTQTSLGPSSCPKGWEQKGTEEEWAWLTGQIQAYLPTKLREQLPQIK